MPDPSAPVRRSLCRPSPEAAVRASTRGQGLTNLLDRLGGITHREAPLHAPLLPNRGPGPAPGPRVWLHPLGMQHLPRLRRRPVPGRGSIGGRRDLLARAHQVEPLPGCECLREASRTISTQNLRDQDHTSMNVFAGRDQYPWFKKKHHAQATPASSTSG